MSKANKCPVGACSLPYTPNAAWDKSVSLEGLQERVSVRPYIEAPTRHVNQQADSTKEEADLLLGRRHINLTAFRHQKRRLPPMGVCLEPQDA